MNPEIVQIILAGIGGGSVVKVLELFLQTRRQRQRDVSDAEKREEVHRLEEFNKDERIVRLVIDEVTKQRDDANKRVEKLEGLVTVLQLEIHGLKLQAGRDPFPRWIVDNAGAYMYINPCFEEQFLSPQGKSAEDLIGKKHADLWPPEFLAKLAMLDELAKRRPDGRAKGSMVVEGKLLTVYKLPVRHLPSGAILGYEGWITDIEPEVAIIEQPPVV